MKQDEVYKPATTHKAALSLSIPPDKREAFYKAFIDLLRRVQPSTRSAFVVDLFIAAERDTLSDMFEHLPPPPTVIEEERQLEERFLKPIIAISIPANKREDFHQALVNLKYRYPLLSTSALFTEIVLRIGERIEKGTDLERVV
jgi:hypothetical protein